MLGAERMLAACRLEEVDRTPVWFMRQAGRCLAGYRQLRERYDILTMTRTPELCAQVTTMPVEVLGVDAAVMYADIMLPLTGMGVPFSIDPGVGPIVHEPVRDAAAIDRLRIVDAEDATPELFEAIRLVRKELDGKAALIGFAGAPYTVASYLIEGRPSKDHAMAKALMFGQPAQWHRLMETLAEVTIRYLRAQVAAGTQVLQLFDSWVGDLSARDYEAHVLPYSARIFEGLRGLGVPTIHFGTGTVGLLEQLASAGSTMVSVDWRVPLDEAWRRIGHDKGIQGNLDSSVPLAPWPVIEQRTREVLRAAGDRPGHVFNLGHGVHPETPTDNLVRLVELVHQTTARQAPRPASGTADAAPANRTAPVTVHGPPDESTQRNGVHANGVHAGGTAAAPAARPRSGGPEGVLLLTYGSAVTSADVPEYLRSVYRGKDPDPELVEEFQRRYDLIGRSPLIDITRAQAAALQELLDSEHGAGSHKVAVGMQHSEPKITRGVRELAAAGASRVLGIVLAPQYSPVIMGGYPRQVTAAAADAGVDATVAGPWHLVPAFLDGLTAAVEAALARLADAGHTEVPVIFTAHSLPKSVIDRDTAYIDQLTETAAALAARTGLAEGRWQFAYQSAGHTPEEWLKPDLKDLLPGLRKAGHEAVLVVPIQFLADHLEILFDIDVAAREEAEEAGLEFHRIDLPNTHPLLIRALAQVVERELHTARV